MTDMNDHPGRATRVSSVQDLAQEIRPSRDLWPAIEARLSVAKPVAKSGDAPFGWRAPRALAALAATVAVLGIGIWIGRGALSPGEVAKERVSSSSPMMLKTAGITDPRYIRERAELLRLLPMQIAALPPESQAKVRDSLSTIHKAMQDIEAALGRDSSNALLQELLINTCQDEMRVLTAVQEASTAGKGI